MNHVVANNIKKTAIIGASGFIGGFLLNKYREVYPDTIGTGFSRVTNNLVSFDIRDASITCLKLADLGYKSVVISSAIPNIQWCESNPEESYKINVKGTLNLIKQLQEESIQVIFLSSDYVFNGELGNYLDCSETSPITQYGKQKAIVEREIPNISSNFLILRLSKIYGNQHKDGTLLSSMAHDLVQGKTITAADDQFFSPTFVEDVVMMLIVAQNSIKNQLLNLCNNNKYSRYEIALKLAKALKIPISYIKQTNLHSIPTMEKRPLDTSLICSDLFKPYQNDFVSIESTISKIESSYKSKKERINSN